MNRTNPSNSPLPYGQTPLATAPTGAAGGRDSTGQTADSTLPGTSLASHDPHRIDPFHDDRPARRPGLDRLDTHHVHAGVGRRAADPRFRRDHRGARVLPAAEDVRSARARWRGEV